jgi:hypothetical protein
VSSEEDSPIESYYIEFDDWSSLGEMGGAGESAARYLEQSFQCGEARDKRLERLALWCVLILDKHCTEALAPENVTRLWPPVSASERYDL